MTAPESNYDFDFCGFYKHVFNYPFFKDIEERDSLASSLTSEVGGTLASWRIDEAGEWV